MNVYRTDVFSEEEQAAVTLAKQKELEAIIRCAVETTYRTVLNSEKIKRMMELSSTGDEIKYRMDYLHLYEDDIVKKVLKNLSEVKYSGDNC